VKDGNVKRVLLGRVILGGGGGVQRVKESEGGGCMFYTRMKIVY
jgi:hypothetical protein